MRSGGSGKSQHGSGDSGSTWYSYSSHGPNGTYGTETVCSSHHSNLSSSKRGEVHPYHRPMEVERVPWPGIPNRRGLPLMYTPSLRYAPPQPHPLLGRIPSSRSASIYSQYSTSTSQRSGSPLRLPDAGQHRYYSDSSNSSTSSASSIGSNSSRSSPLSTMRRVSAPDVPVIPEKFRSPHVPNRSVRRPAATEHFTRPHQPGILGVLPIDSSNKPLSDEPSIKVFTSLPLLQIPHRTTSISGTASHRYQPVQTESYVEKPAPLVINKRRTISPTAKPISITLREPEIDLRLIERARERERERKSRELLLNQQFAMKELATREVMDQQRSKSIMERERPPLKWSGSRR